MKKIIIIVLCAWMSAACFPLVESPGEEVVDVGVSISPTVAALPAADEEVVKREEGLNGKSCAEVRGAGVLNLRTGPSVDDPVLTWMMEGEQVEVLAWTTPEWWFVKYSFYYGYARSKYLVRVPCAEVMP